jgi:tetratricopeptide (TPR) repeat protein
MQFPPPGTRIANRYEVAGRPLLGGMGIVYLCFDHQEQRPVALKTFKPEFLPNRAARERFLEEGNTWVLLGKHPHIVRAYGVERIGDGREVYIVLELVAKEEGRRDASLRAWLTPGRPLPVDEALLIALQIVRGMHHATDTIPGFVHRDLKPENVLVGADHLSYAFINRVRVTDFGLVKALPAEQAAQAQTVAKRGNQLGQWTSAGSILGTPHYMAPEQWENADVDVRADIYAFGCILGEMVTGQVLASGNTPDELQRAHQGGHASANARSMSPALLQDLLAGCLAVNRHQRYADWVAVEAALSATYSRLAGQSAPVDQAVEVRSRAERVAAGWSTSALGLAYLDMGNAHDSLDYFRRAYELGRAEGERRLEAAGLTHLGLAYMGLGEASQAINCYETVLAIYGQTGDRRGEGNVLGNLGEAHRQLGHARQAIEYHEQALSISREIGNRRGEGADLGNLGGVYLQLGDARRAIEYYQQAHAIYATIGDRVGKSNALGNLGNAWRELGEPRRAIGFHEKALAIHRAIGDRHGEGDDLAGLGSAFASLGDVREGKGYLQQALSIHRELGDLNAIAMDCFNLAVLYARHDELGSALPLAQEAGHLWEQMGHHAYARDAQELAARLEDHDSGNAQGGGDVMDQIVSQFAPIIDAVVAAAWGDREARGQIEAMFDMLTQAEWMIADPIQRIWAGERNEATLTAGLEKSDARIVHEILRRL